MRLVPYRRPGPVRRRLERRWQRWTGRRRPPSTGEATVVPDLDLFETPAAFVAELAVPGCAADELDVHLLGRRLIVSGRRGGDDEARLRHLERVEWGGLALRREIDLPGEVRLDPRGLSATCRRGVLRVTVPKAHPVPCRTIPVRGG